jgi:hypothetical protein
MCLGQYRFDCLHIPKTAKLVVTNGLALLGGKPQNVRLRLPAKGQVASCPPDPQWVVAPPAPTRRHAVAKWVGVTELHQVVEVLVREFSHVWACRLSVEDPATDRLVDEDHGPECGQVEAGRVLKTLTTLATFTEQPPRLDEIVKNFDKLPIGYAREHTVATLEKVWLWAIESANCCRVGEG